MKLTVIQGGLSQGPEDDEIDLHGLVKSDEIRAITELAIANIINKNGVYAIPPIGSRLAHPEASSIEASQNSNQGFCQIHNQDGKQYLIVNDTFAGYLAQEGGFESVKEAAQFAAIYTRALDVLSGAVNLANVTKGLNADFTSPRRSYWDREHQGSNRAAIYRGAGLVAIEAMQIEPDFKDKPPYAPHVAGIVDPLRPDGAAGLIRFSPLLLKISQMQ